MVFSLGHLIRPFGSLVFGYVADHYGRSISLKLSLFLMALPTCLIGLLPTGLATKTLPIILLLTLRTLQGFAAGGELPGSTCYIFESSPTHKKNFYCSLVASSSLCGVFSGSLVTSGLYSLLSESEIDAWAWRLPFLFGFIIALFIFILRRSITETKIFSTLKVKKSISNYVNQLYRCRHQVKHIFLLNVFISTAFYLLFVWMPSYLYIFLDVPQSIAHLTTSIGLFFLIIFTLFIGYISNEHQRKQWIKRSIFLMGILACPLFALLQTKLIIIFITVQIIFALILSFINGVINATMGSLLQPEIRASGIGIGFTFSTAIFGGLAPTLSSWLVYRFDILILPAVLIIFASIFAIPSALNLYNDQECFSA